MSSIMGESLMPKGIPLAGFRRTSQNAIAMNLDDAYIPEPNTGCWLWNHSCSGDGYGTLRYQRRRVSAHRLFYELANRTTIPKELTVDHLCRVPTCVNPSHMEIVTMRVNTLRGMSPMAKHAKKTHCKHGHPFAGENLIRVPLGRRCRECSRRWDRESKKRRSTHDLIPEGWVRL
jgi:hypothetical protein